MIIDVILDRKDSGYYSNDDTRLIYLHALNFKFDYLSQALDYGTEQEVKVALKRYIVENGYNEDICNYIDSVDWLVE